LLRKLNQSLARSQERERQELARNLHDLVGQNRSIPLFVRVGYHPAEEWTISAMAGVLLGGEIRIETDDGDKVASSDYDPAPFVGLGVSWRK